MPTDAVVIVPPGAAERLVARSQRALERMGCRVRVAHDPPDLVVALRASPHGAWVVRAGAWPRATSAPVVPSSATKRMLAAVGATTADPAWAEVLSRSGGDLGGELGSAPVRHDSVFFDDAVRASERVAGAGSFDAAMRQLALDPTVRVVRVPSLDVHRDDRLRIVQAVTTLHRGGAERVVLDLVRTMRAGGHAVTLAVMDRPSRSTFDAPEGTVFLTAIAPGRADRARALRDLSRASGADVVHAHLLEGDEVWCLREARIPVVVTVHNARQGWPRGMVEPASAPSLFVGCSRAVTAEVADATDAPVRTAWNGIERGGPVRDRWKARRELGIDGDGTVVACVANHRPQKRLERLPAVVRALADLGEDPLLLLVGEPVKRDPEAFAIAESVRREAEALGVGPRVRTLGSLGDVSAVYAASDAVVSLSAYEGLSLVHMEALACGTPLVTTAVSGSEELAAKHPHVRVVPLDADPHAVARAVLEARGEASGRLAPDFTVPTMTARYVELLQRATAAPRRREGLVLVTNNFSTGGAQSSARRLLLELARSGVAVSAVVVQEQKDHPTPGRRALERGGIGVFAAPRAGDVDPKVTADAVVRHVDHVAPAAVLFWNVIPEHKVLIADALVDVPVWDVSPGEMYFASLERYFARPRERSPYLVPRDYGRLLAGVVVKYGAERERAREVLGAPTRVIANGVVVPERIQRQVRERRPFVVGTLARIEPDKKLEQLVLAVRRASDRLDGVEVVVAGAAPRGAEDYEAELRRMSEGLPIRFVGEQEASAFLSTLDLFAMVSEPMGCPNASLEAMAHGLAVVATDAGAASEQIVHDETGLLVGRGDVEALGDAIARLAADPSRCHAMGVQAHVRAKESFSVTRMAAEYARLCLGVSLGDVQVCGSSALAEGAPPVRTNCS